MSSSAIRNSLIRLIVASAVAAAAAQPPPDLARRVAESESAARLAREDYLYRQEVLVEELSPQGGRAGHYGEVREVIFTPGKQRTEQFVGRPYDGLRRLRLTEEDFRDIRQVQPFLFTREELWLYETRFRGEENVDGVACWLLEVRPRQVLDGQRLFDGTIWVDKGDYSVVKTDGRAVPQILRRKSENLFPRFTTFREKIDGRHRFPIYTYADDTLPFSSGPIRMRMTIKYSNYRRFEASSTILFDKSQGKK